MFPRGAGGRALPPRFLVGRLGCVRSDRRILIVRVEYTIGINNWLAREVALLMARRWRSAMRIFHEHSVPTRCQQSAELFSASNHRACSQHKSWKDTTRYILHLPLPAAPPYCLISSASRCKQAELNITMKLVFGSLLISLAVSNTCHVVVDAFSLRMAADLPPPLRQVAPTPPPQTALRLAPVAAAPMESRTLRAPTPRSKPATLGLLTFDLDDSLYPIEPVLADANNVFVETMASYGYSIEPQDIVNTGKQVREEAGPIAGAAMSHTEVRMAAIRREMEKCAKGPVSEADVERVYCAWERERHHSAERHLYPEVLSSLQKIKEQHPDVIIGAVTDGKANPMQMVFTLAPHFDFCMSWEDDAAGRTEFFKELSNVNGHADLQWIYRAAYDRYTELAEGNGLTPGNAGDTESPAWIHVGDDLAYDVGGSAACGANTILLDLDSEYKQTAKSRFLWGGGAVMPSWNTASDDEIANRKAMNDAAEMMVDKRVSRLTLLPDVIDEILKGE